MTKKPKGRFGYLEAKTENVDPRPESAANIEDELRTVPRGQGRMEQDRTQLNVRIPTKLKRRAAAKAALKGETLGDVVEALLETYVESSENS